MLHMLQDRENIESGDSCVFTWRTVCVLFALLTVGVHVQ